MRKRILAASFAFAFAAPAAGQTTLNFNNWIPPSHFMVGKGFLKYFEDVEKATEGRVKIKTTAQSLGAPPRQMQLAVDGIADVAWGVHSYTPGTFPLAEMVELPFINSGAGKDSVAYWRVYKALFEKTGMHPAAVHTLTVHVQPEGEIYTTSRAVKSVDDFKGLKLRIVNPVSSIICQKFSAVPIAMPVTAMRDALSKGVVDGTFLTPDGVTGFNIAREVKHAILVEGGFSNASFFMVMNKKKWEAISDKDRAAIDRLSGEALARRLGSLWEAEAKAEFAKLEKGGMLVTKLDAATTARMKEALSSIEQAWIEKAKAKGIDGAAAIAMFRAETAKP